MRYFLSVLSLVLYCFSLNAQKLDSVLENYGNHFQQEKMYLQYDKSSYLAGETIWFKAYLLEGIYPVEGSKTLYTDWVGDNGTVFYHSVSPIVSGVTNGQFEIPASYKGNFIHVRSYTKWMLNFDSAFIYQKDIRIINKTGVEKNSKPAIVTTLQFFPEGGDAIAGITNKIAFKATDQWGRPVKIKGVITSPAGALVDSFQSVHDGMGYLMLNPQANTIYTAKWKDDKNVAHTTNLPVIKQDGVSMQVAVIGSKRYIKLTVNNQASDNYKLLHIIGTMNQHPVFKTDASLSGTLITQKIVPVNNLPSGILTITLFDANWNAIAERITFVDSHDYKFNTSMEVQHWGLSKRARNEVDINLPDSFPGGSFSVSVTDAAIEKDTADNIISHLLLTSDIKGIVYNPSWYFSDHGDSTTQFLDLVMLTNGWRRFKWEELLKGKYPAITYPKDTNYLALNGKVFGVARSQLSGNDNIVLLIKGGKDTNTRMTFMPIHQDGTFGDPSMIFFDSLHIYYHLKSKFFSNAEARFMPNLLPAPNYISLSKTFNSQIFLFDTIGFYHHSALASEAIRLQELEKGRILEAVTIRAKTKSPIQLLDEKYASGLFKGSDSYNFDLVNDPLSNAYQNIFFYLSSKVAGLQINPTSNPPSAQWRGATPAFYLDEVPTDVEMLSSIPVSDVAYIKVFRPPFIGAVGGGSGGAIAIYTRRGNDVSSNTGKGLNSNTITSYTPVKEFYSPNYSSFNPRNEQADIRTTIYWNPAITISAGQRTTHITFYNNDVTKTFRVVIEGMAKDGMLTHHEEIME